MKIDRAGYPFIAGALLPALILAALRRPRLALPLVALAAALAAFFRDPERHPPVEPGVVLSPADGRVVVAGDPQPGVPPEGEWRQVSIFLSPLDVHVNRMPAAGRVSRIEYRRGGYRPAYAPASGVENERNEIWIECEGGPVIFRQITGVLVRRVVCRARVGDVVKAGDRFGVMKFGSRIDLFLPAGTDLLVSPGDRVRAGESVLARLA
ncbi:MAG: phosphatidylserine decarboxylase [Acidobacteria bacterium]|nr:phosphatidylserine decarboxylase [Acidobacteriota bacterium]